MSHWQPSTHRKIIAKKSSLENHFPSHARAGEGNRTLTTSLEGWGSTVELHPQRCLQFFLPNRTALNGSGRIRTSEGMSQQIYSLSPLAAWVHSLELFNS